MSVELALGALLAAVAVVFVAVPFLRTGDAPAPAEPSEEALVAAEERDRALAELKELEFDHRTGKVTDEDYRALVQPLREARSVCARKRRHVASWDGGTRLRAAVFGEFCAVQPTGSVESHPQRAGREVSAARETGPMARRILCCLTLVLLAAAPAAGGLYDRKQDIDSQISSLQSKLEQARAREASLSAEIASVSQRIRSLESEVGDVSTRLVALEEDLALHQRKLDRLTELYELQTERLEFLRSQYGLSQKRWGQRLVAIYEQGEPSTLDVLVQADNFSDILDQLDYVSLIAAQDRAIVDHVEGARDHMRELRAQTGRTKARVAAITRVIKIRTDQQRALKNQLVARQQGLAAARQNRRATLAAVHADASDYAAEAAALQAQSANLAAQIRSAQAAAPAPSSSSGVTYSSGDGTPSASGFIWPVGGPVVSPFGWRWGRMHEGIDIGAGYGTPIAAAASGNVIYAGWMGGYGNLIIIDHGGGIATAYAHQSSFAVGGGGVSQGQTIGYVGCTGHCYGPHLHFEVRLNGSAVDPLGYL